MPGSWRKEKGTRLPRREKEKGQKFSRGGKEETNSATRVGFEKYCTASVSEITLS